MDPRDSPTTVRIAGSRRGRAAAARVLVVGVVFLAAAVVKPWGALVPAGVAPAADVPGATAPPRDAAATRTADPGQLAAGRLARVCLEPSGWRVAATERWRDASIRSWRAVDAVAASGPLDPAIRTVPVSGESVPAIGYCAPIEGRDRPPADARGTVLAVEGDAVRPLDVRRLAPPDDTSGGAIWAAPVRGPADSPFASTWPTGRYVIRIATPDDRYVRWIAIEIFRPFIERLEPSPSVTIPG